MRLLTTYTEKDEFHNNNDLIGFYSGEILACELFNIWIAELYKNKNTGKYSVFIIADSDEQWAVIDYE